MDLVTAHLKSDLVASLRKLADDVEDGALLEGHVEIHNEVMRRRGGDFSMSVGVIEELKDTPDLAQHRNATIMVRWADLMPEDQAAAETVDYRLPRRASRVEALRHIAAEVASTGDRAPASGHVHNALLIIAEALEEIEALDL